MATLNRAYGDYRHVLRERPCLLGKTEDHYGRELVGKFSDSGQSGSFYEFHADIAPYLITLNNGELGKLTERPSNCPVDSHRSCAKAEEPSPVQVALKQLRKI